MVKKKDTMDAKCAVTGRMCVTFNLFTQDEPDFFSLLITNYNNAEGTTKWKEWYGSNKKNQSQTEHDKVCSLQKAAVTKIKKNLQMGKQRTEQMTC